MFGQRITQHPEASCHVLCVVGRCAQSHGDHITGRGQGFLGKVVLYVLYDLRDEPNCGAQIVDHCSVQIENIERRNTGGTAQMVAIRSTE
jgi:hypothetical protein